MLLHTVVKKHDLIFLCINFGLFIQGAIIQGAMYRYLNQTKGMCGPTFEQKSG